MVRLVFVFALLAGCASSPGPAPEEPVTGDDTPVEAVSEAPLEARAWTSDFGRLVEAPDAQPWSAEQVAELHRRINELLSQHRYNAAYDLAFENRERPMRATDIVATLELAGRAAGDGGPGQIGSVYGNLVFQLRAVGLDDPRTRLRLLTGKAYNHMVHQGKAPARETMKEAMDLLEATPAATPLERGRALLVHAWSRYPGDAEMDTATVTSLLLEAWALIEASVPAGHSERIRPLHLLTYAYMSRGKYAEGLPYARSLLALLKTERPEQADRVQVDRVAWLELAMGTGFAETGEGAKATDLAESAVARIRAMHVAGPGQPELLAVILDVASHCHLRNKDVKRALVVSTEAMKILEDPAVELWGNSQVAILTGMARVRRAQKKKKEALELFKRAALTATLKTRDSPREVAYSQVYLYLYLLELGRKAEAEKMKEHVHQLVEEAGFPKGNRIRKHLRDGKFEGY